MMAGYMQDICWLYVGYMLAIAKISDGFQEESRGILCGFLLFILHNSRVYIRKLRFNDDSSRFINNAPLFIQLHEDNPSCYF